LSFVLGLEYTPRRPQEGLPFTEESFARRRVPFEFEPGDIGIALVDLWNFGWEDGPIGETLGPELSFERGRSHAERKRRIIESRIAPATDTLRSLGVRIFHCNHAGFLSGYPQWLDSATEAERAALAPQPNSDAPAPSRPQRPKPDWPPPDWSTAWRDQRERLVWDRDGWSKFQGKEVYPKIRIPEPVQPQPGDLLVYSREQFHRLLTERRIRALFYMGFETDECILYSGYGIANMRDGYSGFGYLCTIVRDCTATYEVAETLEGQWKTRLAVIDIETRFGYSILSDDLIAGVRAGA
jgi:nicotinamidase-related amidase